jgi:thioredoxin reductase (NADPH)
MGGSYEVVIIGGGAAGLTAGIYASRGNRSVVLLERVEPGGQAATTDVVENYPGFPEIPSGPELMDKFAAQAAKFGAKIERAEATALTPGTPDHTVHTTAGDFSAPAVILACGSDHRKLNVPGEHEFANRGVSYCYTCDAPLFRDKQVVVIGGGDAAVEGSLLLAKFARSVQVLHRRNELRATKILQDRAFASAKITFIWDTVVEQVIGGKLLERIRVRNVKTREQAEIAAQGLFVLIGSTPNTQWLKGTVELDSLGYVKIDAFCRTSVPGVFAAGEVADAVFRQIVVAAGQGCMAAISAERYIQQLTG